MAEPYLTFLCQTTRQWLGLWRPIHHLSGTHKLAEYDIELDQRNRTIYSPQNPSSFRGCCSLHHKDSVGHNATAEA